MEILRLALASCLILAAALPLAASDRDRFIGTWKLISIVDTVPGHEKERLQLGSHPVGYIMYDRTGHMCVQIMATDRPKWSSAEPNSIPTQDELSSASTGYAAYCGHYEVHQKEKYVVHHVELDLVPNSVGTDRKRQYRLSGDRLELTPQPGDTLTWERVK